MPKISIKRTKATFETNNTTYNQPGYTYNQAGWTYGGSDRASDMGAKLEIVNDIRPKMMEVINK